MDKKPYEWDYSGACAPGRCGTISGMATFSLGIFQWLPKKSGKGLKRGKVKYRLRGQTYNPKEVYDKAENLIKELNNDVNTTETNHRL